MCWLEDNIHESQRWSREQFASFDDQWGIGISREGHYFVCLGGNIEKDKQVQDLFYDVFLELEEEGYFMAGLVNDVDRWIMVLDWTVEDSCNNRGEPLHQISEEQANKIRRREKRKIAAIISRVV